MRNGAMSEIHLARFSAVSEFDNYRINCELDGIDVSNMMSRREFVHFLNKATPEMLQERWEMTMNNMNNKEQVSENINNNKKRKWNKKRKTNEVDYDVSAADLFPGDGKDHICTAIDLNDPKVKAEIDEKRREAALLIKQFEKEEDEADEEEMKKMKEKKKKKKMMKRRTKNEVDDDVSAADLFPGDGSDYEFKFLDLEDPEVQAQIDENKRKVQLVIKRLEKELEDREKEEKKMMKEEKKKKLMKKKMKEEKKKMIKRSRSSSRNREE